MYTDQHEYPHFTANQVLSDGDLNLLNDYLSERGRLTRSLLIGTGIACGIEATVARTGTAIELSISPGCGVTSLGHLIVWDKSAALRFRQPYRLRGGSEAEGWFDGPDLWELTADDNPDNDPLTQDFISGSGGMYLILVHEEALIDNKNCERTNCDDKGQTVAVAPRAVLVSRKDLDTIVTGRIGEPARSELAALHRLRNPREDDPVLPEVRLRRWRMPGGERTSTADVFKSFQRAIEETLSGGLVRGLAAINANILPLLDGTVAPLPDLADRLAFLLKDTMLRGAHALDLPHYYDHLRHLVAAYEELRSVVETFHRKCMPAREAFPHHLILNSISDGVLTDVDRTAWVSAPSTNGQSWEGERLRSLLRRLALMIEGLKLRRPPVDLPDVYQPRVVSHPIYRSPWIADVFTDNRVATLQPILANRRFVHVAAPVVAVMEGTTSAAVEPERLTALLNTRLSGFTIGPLRVNTDSLIVERREVSINVVDPRFTPSSLTAVLSERALPSYYGEEALSPYWDYDRNRRGHATVTEPTDLDHALDPHHFLRVRDALGRPVSRVTRQLGRQIQQKGLPVDLVVLSSGQAGRFLETAVTAAQFADLEAIYQSQSYDMLADLLEVAIGIYDRAIPAEDVDRSQRMVPRAHDLFKLIPRYRYRPGSIGALRESGQAGTNASQAYYLTILDKLFAITDTVPDTLAAYGSSTFPEQLENVLQELRNQAADLRGITLPPEFASFIPTLQSVITAADRPSLDALYRQHEARRERVISQGHLARFRGVHPGIRPACGAPLGGTYVIVCHGGGDNTIRRGSFVVTGIVREGAEALTGANVRVVNSAKGTVTDIDGGFSISSPTLPIELEVSYAGYDTMRRLVYETQAVFDMGRPAPAQDDPFPGLDEGTIIADFYLPYRIGDGTAPTVIVAPAAPQKEAPEEPEEPPVTELPFGGAALRYRYPFWTQRPVWKLLNYEEYKPIINAIGLETGSDRLALEQPQLDALNEELAELWKGSIDTSNFTELAQRTGEVLAKAAAQLAAQDDPRFTDFPPLEIEVVEEERFVFMQFSHFGKETDQLLRIDLQVFYTDVSDGNNASDRLEHSRMVAYTSNDASYTEVSTNEVARILSGARATAERKQSPVWKAAAPADVKGDIWIDMPQVGTQNLENGSTAFIELGPTIPSVVTTTGPSVDLETPVPVTRNSGGARAQGIILDAATGNYKLVTANYTTA